MLPAVSCYIHKYIYSYLNTSPACHANHENSKIPFHLINQLIFGDCPALLEHPEITLFFGFTVPLVQMS